MDSSASDSVGKDDDEYRDKDRSKEDSNLIDKVANIEEVIGDDGYGDGVGKNIIANEG